jgi:hypothetical protein
MSLTIDANEVRVETGGSIDVSGKGYSSNASYPGETTAGDGTGGSHIGRGGWWNERYGATYGSVYRPQEAGAASGTNPSGAGGGVVRIDAPVVVVNGTIRANGAVSDRSGAGGSVWITTGRMSGSGSIETNGGQGYYGIGGGGALAIEYTDATSTLPTLSSRTGPNKPGGNGRYGGAGSIYVKGAGSTYGDLTIDNEGLLYDWTILPSLGKGTAQAGTSGATLVTNRSANIPAYFGGHWIEIYTSNGTLKGTWRIATIPGAAKTVTLEPNNGETIDVQPGDTWQGVYRFDNYKTVGMHVDSADPIRVSGTQTIEGWVETPQVSATKLVVKGTLTHQQGQTLAIKADEVRVETGGTIDVTGKGYISNASYPGETTAGDGTGGSHIGRGGWWNERYGATYGSVYRPQEAGAASGTNPSGAGGGVVRIDAPVVVVNGTIRANGAVSDRSGAGGSVWITTGRMSGSGSIETNGGQGYYGIGGGGALAIEYTDATSTLPTLSSQSGPNKSGGNGRYGGAGSIYVKGASSTYGDLTIDASTLRYDATILPSLGAGTALAGTSGAVLVTNRAANVPAYFFSHWVEVRSAAGVLKGTWRIGAISGKTIMLAPNIAETIDVQPGDAWQGVYRFDNVKLRAVSVLSGDAIRSTNAIDAGTTTVDINDGAPLFATAKLSEIVVNSSLSGDSVSGPAGTVADANTPIKITVRNNRTAATYTANAQSNGSFSVPVVGIAGDTFTIFATDSHTVPLTSGEYAVNGAIVELNTLTSLTIQPATVTGGTTVFGSLRLASIPQKSTEVALTKSSSIVTIPASVTFAVGESAKQFPIVTSATTGVVTITASLASSASATLNVVSSEAATLTAVTLSSTTIEGGTSVNGTVTLGAPAPAGGAVVMLASSSESASVQQSVTVAAGASEASFPIFTSRVGAATSTIISATWGQSKAASLQLTPCAAMTDVVAPSSATVNTVWVEDGAPANATVSGEGTFDTTRVATGTSSLHFAPPTTAQLRSWSFTGAAPLLVAPDDTLVFYALVNPCNPPKQLLITWKTGATEIARAAWGESRIEATTAHKLFDSIPVGGQWVRLEVPARALGLTGNVSFTELSVRSVDGEVWIDSIGKSACVLTQAPPPQYGPNESIWFDDALPPGAVPNAAGDANGTGTAWIWDSTQAASGSASSKEASTTTYKQHYFAGATEPLVASRSDLLFAYVLLDPCDPPREVMLEWYDGSWEHRAYWGENLVHRRRDAHAFRSAPGSGQVGAPGSAGIVRRSRRQDHPRRVVRARRRPRVVRSRRQVLARQPRAEQADLAEHAVRTVRRVVGERRRSQHVQPRQPGHVSVARSRPRLDPADRARADLEPHRLLHRASHAQLHPRLRQAVQHDRSVDRSERRRVEVPLGRQHVGHRHDHVHGQSHRPLRAPAALSDELLARARAAGVGAGGVETYQRRGRTSDAAVVDLR